MARRPNSLEGQKLCLRACVRVCVCVCVKNERDIIHDKDTQQHSCRQQNMRTQIIQIVAR